MHLTITALTASALALLLIILAIRTIQLRVRHRVPFGDQGHHPLTSAIRAHANLSEYAPTGILLIGLLEADGAGGPQLMVLAGGFVVTRVMNAIGLFNPPGPPTAARSLGIVGTLAVLLALALWLAARVIVRLG